LLLLGIPLFIAELSLGRQTQRGVVGAFSKFSHNDSSWRLLGWMGILTTYLVAGWYSVIAGWGFHYVLMSLTEGFAGKSIAQMGQDFELFRVSGDLNVLWQAMFLVATTAIVYKGLNKGVEKWNKLLTSTLFIMLVGLAIYSATLDGFPQAVEYILYPDFSRLSPSGVLKALTMALFTLSLGEGIMMTYGSYMQKSEDLPKTAMLITGSIVFIAVLVSLMIFPMVFTFGLQPEAGEGLVFKTLPYVFDQLPGSIILGFLFFMLLIFAALTSAIAQFEVIVANHMDLHGWSREKAVLVTLGVVFIIGLPTALSHSSFAIFPHWEQIFKHSFLETNYILIDWLLALFSIGTAIFVGFVIPEAQRREGFQSGSSLAALYPVWRFLVRYVVPSFVIVILLNHVA